MESAGEGQKRGWSQNFSLSFSLIRPTGSGKFLPEAEIRIFYEIITV